MSFCPYNLIIIPYVHAQGEWVKFKDYDDLRKLDDSVIARDVDELFSAQQEVASLKAEVEQSKRINTELLVLSERQASDIRRLTKAGDAMANVCGWAMARTDGREPKLVENWNAAKQGGQP